uniref:Apolipoprotein L n=1 Tax=Cyprinodon variegatus TaxID=28743 RepID=A0A3Q2D2S7_CYPVA
MQKLRDIFLSCRWKLQRALCQYVTDTLTYMATVKDFSESFSEWKDCREIEYVKMISVKEMADNIDPTFTKSEGRMAAFGKYLKSLVQMNTERKLAELENVLDEVLKGTLEGLEQLDIFLEAIEKLAVTSLNVFTENQILHLPETISFNDVQVVIKDARQICPLLLEFKRDAKSFFLPKLHNVEVLTSQLQKYIQTTKRLIHNKLSFNFEISLEMAEEIAVDPDGLSENEMQIMTNHIKQLEKTRMDEHFRMAFLFQEVSPADFIRIFDDRLPQMLKFLDDLEQCAVQLDRMNKGAKISSVTGSSVGAVGGVLSIVGLALIPVTAGVSSGLIIAGVAIGVTSGTNSLVTTATEFGVNRSNQKRANEAFQSFMKDFQRIQNCLDKVVEQPTTSLEQSEVEVAVVVGKIASKAGTIGKSIDSIVDTASALRALRTEEAVASAGKVVTQDGKALRNISGMAADVPDIGQAAVKGPLALSKGARGGFIALNALFLGMDIFFITKDSMSLAKGTEANLSKFLRARIALFRSQIESWEKICYTLLHSKLTSNKNKDLLKKLFFQVRRNT